jgi:hypothetical protein
MKNIAILAVIFGAFVFTTSCKKIEEPTAVNVIESAGTATIKGYAYADLDDEGTSAGEPEFAPTGTKVFIVINPNDFPGASTYNSNLNQLVYTATVGANGMWEATVKAPKTPINATITADPFRKDYIDSNGDITADVIWTITTESAAVWEGNLTLVDLWWNQ